jgi:hypothetical protein
VTKKEEIRRRWSSETKSLMCGYMIGSPTRERAQWATLKASFHLKGKGGREGGREGPDDECGRLCHMLGIKELREEWRRGKIRIPSRLSIP